MKARLALRLSALAVFAALAWPLVEYLAQAWPGLVAHGTEVFGASRWAPREGAYGGLAMLFGTLSVAITALALAIPFGMGCAVFLSEYAPRALRLPLKAAIELLAAIPSVVFGLVGVLYLREWIHPLTGPLGAVSGDSLFTGGVLLAVMILPLFASLSDDAMRAVPAEAREAARSLGLSHGQAVRTVVVPQAAPALVGAVLLSLGRALGETIAVFLVVGRMDAAPTFPWLPDWIQPGQTVTSKLGGSELMMAYGDRAHWGALLALGLLLWLTTGAVTALGRWWVAGRRAV